MPVCGRADFSALVRAHGGWVYAMARRQLGDAGLAEDAAQVVFIALWRKQQWLAGRHRGLGGWLVQATQYACKDIQKTEGRRKRRERDAVEMETGHEPTRNDRAVETERFLQLDAALRRLSPADRDILVARFFQEQPVREVAEQMHISQAAAEKRISRAIDRLRRIIGDEYPESGRDGKGAVMALLIAGVGRAPEELVGKLLRAADGNAVWAEHIARPVGKLVGPYPHAMRIIALTAVAGLLPLVAIMLQFRHDPVKAAPQSGSLGGTSKARWPGEKNGVLTCVAYQLVTRGDFAWAVQKSGALISGNPKGVMAFSMPAQVVRALVWSQAKRGSASLFPSLHWLHGSFPASVHYSGQASPTVGFGEIVQISNGNPITGITTSLQFHSHLRPNDHAMRLRVQFVDRSEISIYSSRIDRSIPFRYSGNVTVPPRRAVVLLRYVGTVHGRRWYDAVVFDVERYEYLIARRVRYMVDVFKYLHVGPAGVAKIAARSIAWNQYALVHPAANVIPKPWIKSFSNGASVAIAAITTSRWPLCCWTPDGRPLRASQNGDAQIPDTKFTATSMPNGMPTGARRNVLLRDEWDPNCVAILYDLQMPQRLSWSALVWKQATQPIGPLRVGLDYGKWRIGGAAIVSRNFRRYFKRRGVRYNLYRVINDPSAKNSDKSLTLMIEAAGTPKGVPATAVAVGAITWAGKLVAPRPVYNPRTNRFVTSPQTADQEYSVETIPLAASEVKRYVWIMRSLHWLTFPNTFKLQPSPLPDRIDRGHQRLRTLDATSSVPVPRVDSQHLDAR